VIERANRAARTFPEDEGYLNALQVYAFVPGALYQVYTALLRETVVMLQPGETIRAISAGDTERWMVANVQSGSLHGEREVVLIKPLRSGLATNMVLTTDQRTYILELHSYRETYMACVAFHYPQEELLTRFKAAEKQRQERETIIEPRVDLRHLHFDYLIQGDTHARWTPVRVFDDGRKTFVQFPSVLPSTEAPALFILSARGQTQLVNYRVRGSYYIVDRLFEQAELRVGEKKPVTVRIIRQAKEAAMP
jgi:P-type conjugative transfer protein TrbG